MTWCNHNTHHASNSQPSAHCKCHLRSLPFSVEYLHMFVLQWHSMQQHSCNSHNVSVRQADKRKWFSVDHLCYGHGHGHGCRIKSECVLFTVENAIINTIHATLCAACILRVHCSQSGHLIEPKPFQWCERRATRLTQNEFLLIRLFFRIQHFTRLNCILNFAKLNYVILRCSVRPVTLPSAGKRNSLLLAWAAIKIECMSNVVDAECRLYLSTEDCVDDKKWFRNTGVRREHASRLPWKS